MLTIIGNSLIGLGGVTFWFLEKDVNPNLHHFFDAIWWSFSNATTATYGDIVPVTMTGKILAIGLMLMGLALFSMYTGLFAEIVLTFPRGKRNQEGR